MRLCPVRRAQNGTAARWQKDPPAAQEKDAMLRYVGEEVERVKGLFAEKERRLVGEARDAADAAAAEVPPSQLAEAVLPRTQKIPQLHGLGPAGATCDEP